MNVNDRQVGGGHYRSEFQHWDLIEDCGIGYIEGNATAYILRHKRKNGVEDLEKALHYVEKLLSIHLERNRKNRGWASLDALQKFFQANHVEDAAERHSIRILTRWEDRRDLEEVISVLKAMINAAAPV